MLMPLWVLPLLVGRLSIASPSAPTPQIVKFRNGALVLGGELFLPPGKGPFPAVLYNHGSAPGMVNSEASKLLGPLYIAQGWAFFMPYRRGQGLSADAGEYIGDQIRKAEQHGGEPAAAATMVHLLAGDHLSDQMAALEWLKAQSFVMPDRIAVAGNSFGGIETVLGAAEADYCAAIDASGGAESWSKAPELQVLMRTAVRKSKASIFFFQAENDFDLSPSKILSAEMEKAGKTSELKVYPRFGESRAEGHSFAYRGASIWFGDVFRFIQKHCP